MKSPEQSGLEARIGYAFRDPSLLQTALTHTSFVNENNGGRTASNERLEFLGDSVLSIIVTRYLYSAYPDLPEGKLTTMRQNLINGGALAAFARRIGLGEALRLGRGEEKDGRDKPKLLEDAFEALLGALYLDSGNDLERVAAFLLPFVREQLRTLTDRHVPMEDYKTRLQQYVQQTPGEALRYEVVDEQGPDNGKTFTVRVFINSNAFGTGVGSSKKEAEQKAAAEALTRYLPPREE